MGANGYDIQKYCRCTQIIENNNLRMEIASDKFYIYKEEQILGAVDSVDALFNFVTGYDWGNHKVVK